MSYILQSNINGFQTFNIQLRNETTVEEIYQIAESKTGHKKEIFWITVKGKPLKNTNLTLQQLNLGQCQRFVIIHRLPGGK
jgi:hypothetical protein